MGPGRHAVRRQGGLEEFYANVPPGMTRNGVRHISTNFVLVPTEEGARGSACMLALERESRDAGTEITVWGKYEDRLVKTSNGWRFKKRIWRSDTWYDSDVAVVPSPFAPLD